MPFSKLFDRLNINPNESGHNEYARLFPTLSERGREGRAASIFLACLTHVPIFADTLLSPLGRSIGPNSSVVALTEVNPSGENADRPDGLIAVKTGNSFWTCLTEFKVGGTLEVEQVERYLKLARSLNIDAVLTISNEIVPRPEVSPVAVSGRLTQSVKLFHISWMQILSHLQLLIATDLIDDSNHQMIVKEFIRFLVHSSTGIKGFEQMPEEWSSIVNACRDRMKLTKSGVSEQHVVEGWMQEERELAFILSSQTGSPTSVIRRKKQKTSHQEIVDSHLEDLTQHSLLTCSINVKEAAAPIHVMLDLQSRSIRISLELQAPTDRSQARSCVTWLARQLPQNDLTGIDVEADWPRKQGTTNTSFAAICDDPYALVENRNIGLPRRFRIVVKCDLQRRFNSRRVIVECLEYQLKDFYRRVGQHVTAWVPPAPKSRDRTAAEEIVDQATIGDGDAA